MKTDFIVVGSGLAGLTTALTLAEHYSVLLVSKGALSDGSTQLAQGGIAAVITPQDSFALHEKDTYVAGSHHNNKKAVRTMVSQGPDAISFLVSQGVIFDKQKGKFVVTLEGAHSRNRILHATDMTGAEIERALIAAARKNNRITIWEHTPVLELICQNNECFGVVALHKGKTSAVFARAIILATGGVGQLYQWTTNPPVVTGDGIALARYSGAQLSDLEFVQFHPTAFANPTESPLFLLSEALRGEGGMLINSKGERFMERYDKRLELASRDIVARAIFNEQKNGTVYLDMRHLGADFLHARFPGISQHVQSYGYDMSTDLVPVTPAEHFLCGGITTDVNGRTSIQRLFAVGETAATGVHGANRLASNSLLECVVFGRRIIKNIKDLPQKPKEAAYQSLNLTNLASTGKTRLLSLRQQLRETMWNNVGILRTEEGLQKAIEILEMMQKEMKSFGKTTRESIELHNMITTGLLIARAAYQRKESLGGHYLVKS